MCRHSKSDVSGHSSEWKPALAVGGAEKGLLLLPFLWQISLKLSLKPLLWLWLYGVNTVDDCAASQRDWENGEKMGKIS